MLVCVLYSWLLFGTEELAKLEARLSRAAGTEKQALLQELARGYNDTAPLKSIGFAKELLALALEKEDARTEVVASHLISTACFRLNRSQEALPYLERALTLCEQLEDQAGTVRTLGDLAGHYGELDKYDSALSYALRALALLRDIHYEGARVDLAGIYNRAGTIYYRLNNQEKALEFFQKSLDLQTELKNTAGIGDGLNNIGVIYEEQGNYEKALDFYARSLDISQRTGDKRGVASCYNNLAIVYYHQGDLAKSVEYQLKALEVNTETRDKSGEAISHNNLGELYLEWKRYEPAREHMEKARDLAIEIDSKAVLIDAYLNFSRLAEAQADSALALSWYKKFTELKDQIFSEESQRGIAELQASYDLERMSREIQLLKKDKAIYKVTRNAVLVIALLLMAISVLFYNRYRLKTKKNDIIRKKNEELQRLSGTDPLTGLSNRRLISEAIQWEIRRFDRNRKSFVLILADIDNFKQINDGHGHHCGDFILVSLAETMNGMIRRQDILARWGGEEFLFFLPECELEGGYRFAERIRLKVEAETYPYQDLKLAITLTLGVSAFTGGSLESCLKDADEALYYGKRHGKNKVVRGAPV